MNPLAQTIRDRRNAMGMTQLQLAYRANLSAATVSSLESEKANPRIGSLVKAADVLGITIAGFEK